MVNDVGLGGTQTWVWILTVAADLTGLERGTFLLLASVSSSVK